MGEIPKLKHLQYRSNKLPQTNLLQPIVKLPIDVGILVFCVAYVQNGYFGAGILSIKEQLLRVLVKYLLLCNG